jgi:flagellin-like protein
MKGISEIIAIILILMIVIALAALAYTWFSGIFNQLTTTAGSSVTQTATAMGTQFKIENIRNTTPTSISATIRNLGTQAINLTNAGAYYDGVPATSANITSSANPVNPSATSTVVVNMSAILVCGKPLRLTVTTGASDSLTLIC